MIKTRKIIHVDMDCFYAAIEMRDNPTLIGKPIAVGGAVERRGVLATCNYEARKFGLHSAMSTAQAFKLCPNLILLPVNMPLYKQVSQQIHTIFRRYTDLIEPLSLDEAYLDVTDSTACSGSATWIAAEIRQAILTELGLTASAGIAPLKFLAKIASDQNKPNGQFVIRPEEVSAFVATLPLKRIPGVGKVTAQRLDKMGLCTCSDIQQMNKAVLLEHFGKLGQRIWAFSHGIDERQVEPHRILKSVGVERTLQQNIAQLAQADVILAELYTSLIKRLKNHCPHLSLSIPHKVGVKLKFADFNVTTLEKRGMLITLNSFEILLTQIWQRAAGREVRLIGLHVNLPETESVSAQVQMSLW
ncbi:DNA polymerase IV [Bisgaard Taxon 45]